MTNITVVGICGNQFKIMTDPEPMAAWMLEMMVSGKEVVIKAFDQADPCYPQCCKDWLAEKGYQQ